MEDETAKPSDEHIPDEYILDEDEDASYNSGSSDSIDSLYPINFPMTWIDSCDKLEFVTEIRDDFLPQDPLPPKVNKLCVMCDKPAYHLCTYCGEKSEIGWCSGSHVVEFDKIHGTLPRSALCRELEHSQRPHSASRRVFYFPVRDRTNPVCC